MIGRLEMVKLLSQRKTANRNKHVLLKFNTDFKNAIDYYRQYCDKIEDMDTYIFVGGVDGHISGCSYRSYLLKI